MVFSLYVYHNLKNTIIIIYSKLTGDLMFHFDIGGALKFKKYLLEREKISDNKPDSNDQWKKVM